MLDADKVAKPLRPMPLVANPYANDSNQLFGELVIFVLVSTGLFLSKPLMKIKSFRGIWLF